MEASKNQWVKRLDEPLIDLGSGKRKVVVNGRYDERYQITMPEHKSHRPRQTSGHKIHQNYAFVSTYKKCYYVII